MKLLFQVKCSIYSSIISDEFAFNFPNAVCRECDARAVNEYGEPPQHIWLGDYGDNPIFIDGKKCWRKYADIFGYFTMLDDMDCESLEEFYEKHNITG